MDAFNPNNARSLADIYSFFILKQFRNAGMKISENGTPDVAKTHVENCIRQVYEYCKRLPSYAIRIRKNYLIRTDSDGRNISYPHICLFVGGTYFDPCLKYLQEIEKNIFVSNIPFDNHIEEKTIENCYDDFTKKTRSMYGINKNLTFEEFFDYCSKSLSTYP
jgi:hypothetical protein